MKTGVRISLALVVTAVFGLFSTKSQAQCDFHFGGRGFSIEFYSGDCDYEDNDRYYDHDGRGYDRDCEYERRHRYDRRREYYLDLIPPLPERRRPPQTFRQYAPENQAQPRETPQRTAPRSVQREKSVPPASKELPGYVPAPKSTPPSSGKAVQGESVSPYENEAPKKDTQPAPKKAPAKAFDLQLPDPAPRDNRDATRIAPPNPVTPPKVGGSSAKTASLGKFPIDMVIANSDDEFTTLREVIGEKRAVLVDFWASWCGPCIQSMPELKRRSEGLAPYDIVVAGMNVESDIAIAASIRKKHDMQDVVWLVEPESQPFSEQFKIQSIPQVMVISQNGDILFQGYPGDAKLAEVLDELTAN